MFCSLKALPTRFQYYTPWLLLKGLQEDLMTHWYWRAFKLIILPKSVFFLSCSTNFNITSIKLFLTAQKSMWSVVAYRLWEIYFLAILLQTLVKGKTTDSSQHADSSHVNNGTWARLWEHISTLKCLTDHNRKSLGPRTLLLWFLCFSSLLRETSTPAGSCASTLSRNSSK